MFTRWSDFDQTMAFMDEFRRRIDRVFNEYQTGTDEGVFGNRMLGSGTWPRANVFDTGGTFLVTAEVPGLADKDINLTLTNDTLTIAGERPVDVPKGYSVHRQERTPVKFSRSIYFPNRVDAEKTRATVKNGLLTVELNKIEEEKPRMITVKAG